MTFELQTKVKRLFYLLLPLAFIIISVPWFFSKTSEKMILGLPHWVGFSLLGAACFALLMAVLIGFGWELSAGKHDDDSR